MSSSSVGWNLNPGGNASNSISLQMRSQRLKGNKRILSSYIRMSVEREREREGIGGRGLECCGDSWGFD